MHLTLLGYYGYRNFGDDILLLSLLDRLSRVRRVTGIRVLVREDPYGGDPLFRFDEVSFLPTARWWEKLRKYRYFPQTDLLLWGGGTCLYEPETGDIRGMESFARNIRIFRLLGKRYGFLGIGMAPLRSTRARGIAERILRGASIVTFRDPSSFRIAADLCGEEKARAFQVCGDLFFLSEPRLQALRGERREGKSRRIAFCGYGAFAEDEQRVRLYAGLLDRLVEELGARISFLPMQVHPGADDNHFHARVQARMRHGREADILSEPTIPSLVSAMGEVDFVIGMRLHAVILSDVLRIPNLAIAYHPKVHFYADTFGALARHRVLPLDAPFSPGNVGAAERAFLEGREEIERVLGEHRRGAERNLAILEAFLEAET